MIFTKTEIAGAWLIDVEPLIDERGFFARSWCQNEFAAHGAASNFVQANLAATRRRGTLRGLHFQAAPCEEAKLVRCTRGAAYVVAADLRHESATYLRWIGVELSAENHRALYVPPGCAQGYQTLADETEMFYQMSQFYAPGMARGVRYDDPALDVAWPLEIAVISEADRNWPAYQPQLNPALAAGPPSS
ncbi:MAG TPA: dTDP-4-dehydrorhamnose 3,5-epimerase [Pirellulales bacterium]|jgi:dTDP-4-dehydrorhamnose 3,5-epimerase|nr:dTDP-4-dehydrorhamnose 3,5-epimerase [Pirellulales bacterium]